MTREDTEPSPATDEGVASAPAARAPRSLTEGPVGPALLAFAVPTLAGSVLQSINATINAAWIGRLLGQEALTASANANTVVFFLIGATFGLGLAATVLVAQSLGAKDLVTAKKTIGTSLTFFGGISVILGGLGLVLAPSLLAAMGTPHDALPLAVAYLRVTFLAFPGIVLYSFLTMSLRGAGDAKTPFVFLLLSAVLDAVLNPLFIKGLGPVPAMGIAGAAVSSFLAQWIALFAMVGWLYARKNPLRLTRDELHLLKVDPAILRTLIAKGVPMGLSVVLMSASMIAMISLVNRGGSKVTAAYGACFQLWNYIQMPSFALGSAVSSMAAQNVGAQKWDRVSRVASLGVLFTVILTSALVLLATLAHRAAFSLFLGDDPAAIAIAHHIHLVVSWSFVLFGVSFVLSSVVRATGAVMVPLAVLFASLWLVRIPFAYALHPTLGQEAIWWSFPMGSASSMVLSFLYFRFGSWRDARMMPAGRT